MRAAGLPWQVGPGTGVANGPLIDRKKTAAVVPQDAA